jgi:selenide, water dikinase
MTHDARYKAVLIDTNNMDPIRLTSFAHGGGCGCKIAPGVLTEILSRTPQGLIPAELMVGIETADDAAVS